MVLYAALLLEKLGRDVTSALAAYGDDRRAVTVHPGGCMVFSMWLAEAIRYVTKGELWQHPVRKAEQELASRAQRFTDLERVTWFRLPTPREVRGARNGEGHRDPFLSILTSPSEEQREHRADIEALAARGNFGGRLYGALLLRHVDPAAGERALDELATCGALIAYRRDKPLLRTLFSRLLYRDEYDIENRPIADVVAELRHWKP